MATEIMGRRRKVCISDINSAGRASRFRPDIEGLRALAVAAVLLYHAGVPHIPGGFVGVDVFFVISGYLISGHLLVELRSTGTIKLTEFYARRAKRLLPAASALLTFVAIATLFIFPSDAWIGIAKDILASALYVMNWRLADEAVNYLAADTSASPLQHFWSLGVEEQYYLLWPLLLIMAVYMLRSRRGTGFWHFFQRRPEALSGRSVDIILTVVFLIVAIPSFAWSLHLTRSNPGAAYFVTTTRLWELSVGSLVAILSEHLTRLPRRLAATIAWLGLLDLVGTIALLTTSTPFPGWVAGIPVAGAAAVIAAGPASGSWGPTVLLQLRPCVWLGGISYAVYLWHWPLLVLARTRWGDLDHATAFAIVAASVLPAWLSTRFVEAPIRRSERFVEPRHSAALGFAFTMAAVLAGEGAWLANWPGPPPPLTSQEQAAIAASAAERTASGSTSVASGAQVLAKDAGAATPRDTYKSLQPPISEAVNDNPSVYSDGCHQQMTQDAAVACLYGDRSSKYTVAVVGDSHAAQWVPALQVLAIQNRWRLLTYTKSSCPLAQVIVPQEDVSQPYTSCQLWNRAVMGKLTGPNKPQAVFVSEEGYRIIQQGQVLTGASADAAFATGLHQSWSQLVSAGVTVVALRDTPHPGIDVPTCMSQHTQSLSHCAVSRTKATAGVGDAQQDAAGATAGVHFVDLNEDICPREQAACSPVIGGVIVYRDSNHLTATYSRSLSADLDAALKGIPGLPLVD